MRATDALVPIQTVGRLAATLSILLLAGIGLGSGSSVEAAANSVVKCYANDLFFVIARERSGETGTDFFFRPKSKAGPKPECRFTAKPGDRRYPASAKTPTEAYFLGLWKNRLALDSGTASQNRQLLVVDMTTGKVLFKHATFNDAKVDGGTATIDEASDHGTKATCPNLTPDLVESSRMVRESTVDLDSFAVTQTDKVSCQYSEGG